MEKLMFKISITVFCLIIFCVIGVHGEENGAVNEADVELRLNEEIEKLEADNAAWQSNDTEFRKMREQGAAAESDVYEFAEFVAGLKRKVIEGCEAVRLLGGDGAQHGVDCVKLENESKTGKGRALDRIKRRLTREERTALLNEKLKKLESDFDGMILDHQTRVNGIPQHSQSNEGRDANGNANGNGNVGGAVGDSKSSSEPVENEAVSGAGPGMEKQGAVPVFEPGDIGNGSDDDVVARQLREAAESETDPLLKEKLWDEYKKYKKSAH